MRTILIFALASLFIGLLGCAPKTGTVDFIVLQLNDVYEIAPLEGGKSGGLARVATVRKQLLEETPHVVTILSGDFLSPSLIGTLKNDDGSRIAGAQMVATLNALGLDYAIFGNHEFDIDQADLQKRINESEFAWIASNVKNKSGDEISDWTKSGGEAFPEYVIRDIDGVKVGFSGITIPFNKQPYVHYENFDSVATAVANILDDKSDVQIAITHLLEAQDVALANANPVYDLIAGGHDHHHMLVPTEAAPVAKADANAKTVYIHRFSFDRATGQFTLASELKKIDDTIADEPTTKAVVDEWISKANGSMSSMGYDPNEVITTVTQPLDGRESVIRNQQTNLGKIIAESMRWGVRAGYGAVLNSGSVRVDDQLSGQITQYDILRTLPFGGEIVSIDMSGNDLLKLLETGTEKNVGSGGYLQLANLRKNNQGQWLIGEERIRSGTGPRYRIAMPAFLASGRESNLGFLKDLPADTPKTLKPTDFKNDIRDAVIEYLKRSGAN